MKYTSISTIIFGLTWIVLGLMMNATKSDIVSLLSDFKSSTEAQKIGAVIFSVSLFLSLLLALLKLNKNRSVNRIKKKNLYPYYESNNVKELTKYFISTRIQDSPPSDHKDFNIKSSYDSNDGIKLFMNKIFNKSTSRFYLILGGAGMGKTTFMVNLYLRYIAKGGKFQIKLIPLNNPDGIEEIENMSTEDKTKTIILLDGLDEGFENSKLDKLKIILQKTWNFRKVIITCRTQFFDNFLDEPNEAPIPNPNGGYFKIKKFYISPFTKKECKKYIKRKFKVFQFRKKSKALKLIDKIPNILARPMILSKIEDMVSIGVDKPEINKIYKQIIQKWIEREANKLPLKLEERNQFAQNLNEFSMAIARKIFSKWKNNKQPVLQTEEILKEAQTFNINPSNIKITEKSLLNRDKLGNWKFAHSTIWEYIIAISIVEKNLVINQEDLDKLTFASFIHCEITLLNFFREIIKNNQNSKEIVWFHSQKNKYLTKLDTTSLDEIYDISDLEVSKHGISDFSPLSHLPLLEKLELFGNPFNDISFLKNFKNIRWLDVRDSEVFDLEPLREHELITTLNLKGTLVSDLTPIRKFRILNNLNLRKSKVIDISPLKNINSLQTLHLGFNKIQDISILKELHNIINLDLKYTEVTDLNPLKELKNLRWLNISGSKILDLEPINNLKSLEELDVSYTELKMHQISELKKYLPDCIIKI